MTEIRRRRSNYIDFTNNKIKTKKKKRKDTECIFVELLFFFLILCLNHIE
jgi:hypothetical protein